MIEINLTKREYEVLLELSTGASNKQIADKLHVTRRTIESHIANILYKSYSANRGEIIVKYFSEKYEFVINKNNFKYVKILNLFKTNKLQIKEIADRVNTSYNYTNAVIVKFKKGLTNI